MKTAQKPLPEFGKPPVIEVVLSVQFDELEQLAIPHIGLLWERYRDTFPITEQKPLLNAQIEKFDGQQETAVGFRVFSEPPMPRCWFHNKARTELIQVQKDRFVFNWRSAEGDLNYPRYPAVRGKFDECFKIFEQFIQEENLGQLSPNQCEVTYVNHIFWHNELNHGMAAPKIFPMITGTNSDSFLNNPEEIHLRWVYRLMNADGKSIGRLHIAAEPRTRTSDKVPLYRLGITARGAPFETTREGVLSFFDFGREQVVRGFASITSREMHASWERNDVS